MRQRDKQLFFNNITSALDGKHQFKLVGISSEASFYYCVCASSGVICDNVNTCYTWINEMGARKVEQQEKNLKGKIYLFSKADLHRI